MCPAVVSRAPAFSTGNYSTLRLTVSPSYSHSGWPSVPVLCPAADLLSWKGYSMCDCSAEFRLFWVGSKLEEAGATAVAGSAPHHARRFAPVPAYRCTPEGLTAAHSGPVPFTRDGLWLLHREAHYAAGPTPLALLWKDAASSRYVIDTDPAGGLRDGVGR